MIETHLELLQVLSELEPTPPIFGGVAEDALLSATFSRPHADVDVFVIRADLDLRRREFGQFGFEEFEVRYAPRPGQPLAMGSPQGETDLEIGVFDLNDGDVYFEVEDGNGLLHRVSLPTDAVDHDVEAAIDGIKVRTLSPLALVHIRRGLERLGTFGPLREKDIAVQKRLLDRFFDGSLPSEPRIERSPE